jgi:hypothetical protein
MVIGLIAGGGDLPLAVIAQCKQESLLYCVVGFRDVCAQDFLSNENIFWASLGEVGGILNFFKRNNVTHVIFAGHISRPNLKNLKLDAKGFQWLAKLGKKILGGDNQLLVGIENLLKQEGFQVLSAGDFTKTVARDVGTLSINQPDAQQWQDINLGVKVLQALSEFDIGQSIVVANNQVIGIEAVEGTKSLIERCESVKETYAGGVLVKCSKIAQSHNIDLPTIGPETVLQAKKAGIIGIAIETNKTQILHKQEVIRLLDEYEMFFVVLNEN